MPAINRCMLQVASPASDTFGLPLEKLAGFDLKIDRLRERFAGDACQIRAN